MSSSHFVPSRHFVCPHVTFVCPRVTFTCVPSCHFACPHVTACPRVTFSPSIYLICVLSRHLLMSSRVTLRALASLSDARCSDVRARKMTRENVKVTRQDVKMTRQDKITGFLKVTRQDQWREVHTPLLIFFLHVSFCVCFRLGDL